MVGGGSNGAELWRGRDPVSFVGLRPNEDDQSIPPRGECHPADSPTSRHTVPVKMHRGKCKGGGNKVPVSN